MKNTKNNELNKGITKFIKNDGSNRCVYSIKDRMQPVFNDLNPAHVTFLLLNKQTLSIQILINLTRKCMAAVIN